MPAIRQIESIPAHFVPLTCPNYPIFLHHFVYDMMVCLTMIICFHSSSPHPFEMWSYIFLPIFCIITSEVNTLSSQTARSVSWPKIKLGLSFMMVVSSIARRINVSPFTGRSGCSILLVSDGIGKGMATATAFEEPETGGSSCSATSTHK